MTSKYSPVESMYRKYGPLLEGFLARNNYPTYVMPSKILSLEPNLFQEYDLPHRGQIRVLGACISEYRGPHGERYVKYSARFWKLTPAQELTLQEATA